MMLSEAEYFSLNSGSLAVRIKIRPSHLRSNIQGSIPILLAVMLVPIIGFAGAAIDYGRSIADRTRLNSALDAAVIAGAQAAARAEAIGLADEAIREAAETTATASFDSTPKFTSDTKSEFKASIANRSVLVSGDYTSLTPTTLMKSLGFNQINLSGHAQSGVDLSPMVDIYLLVDVSGSMAIGATDADINRLKSNLNCAFACHDGVKVKGTKYDAFEWAQAKGITLRLNEMNTGLKDFISWLEKQPNAANRFRVSLYSLSKDLTKLVDITSNLSQVSSNLPQAPSVSASTAGGTHFKENMPLFASAVGIGGDGSTNPKKLVIIASDGVQDQDRTWSDDRSTAVAKGQGVAPFDPSACRSLDSTVSVGVLYTPYLKMEWDWGYNATLGQKSQIKGQGTRFDDIIPQLQSCASSADLFVNAATTTSVGNAFKNIFQKFTSIRLAQ